MDATALVDAMMMLSRSPSHARPLEVFDVVMQGRADQVLDFAGRVDPGTAFGQLIAIAFDPCMTPHEWAAFTGPDADPSLRDGCMQISRTADFAHARRTPCAARYAVPVQGV
jgi:hypothetical protein